MTLFELTGGRYKITFDECWEAQERGQDRLDRAWYELIPTRGGGHIRFFCEAELPCPLWAAGCPLRLSDCREHGDLILNLWTPRPKNAAVIWKEIKAQPSCHYVPMDGEADLFFPARLVHRVAQLTGARRKKRLYPEARARLAEVGRATRFPPQKYGIESA